jgi:hypothetical protein
MSLPRPVRPITVQHPAEPSPAGAQKLDSNNLRPSDSFFFQPKSDITITELSELIAALDISVHFDRFLKFTESLQRHFAHKKIS